jgi:hypothetical protein
MNTTNDFKIIKATPQKYGRLTIVEIVGKNAKWQKLVRCVCECGSDGVFRLDHVKSGRSKSCGCLNREATAARNARHGGCRRSGRQPEFSVWIGMRDRCFNPRCESYPRYGARGITVCDKWRTSYGAFIKDVGRRPSKAHALERINNNGNYEPGNVKWATRVEQCNNRSTNRLVEMGGRTMTLAEWSRITPHLKYSTIQRRLKAGWEPEKALTTPSR